MSKTNDTSKRDRAPQVRELRDDELLKVSGGTSEPLGRKNLALALDDYGPHLLP